MSFGGSISGLCVFRNRVIWRKTGWVRNFGSKMLQNRIWYAQFATGSPQRTVSEPKLHCQFLVRQWFAPANCQPTCSQIFSFSFQLPSLTQILPNWSLRPYKWKNDKKMHQMTYEIAWYLWIHNKGQFNTISKLISTWWLDIHLSLKWPFLHLKHVNNINLAW